mmetsp:Transcript_1934/g.4213  ORF Transcript_1934/g.4213 Transcript_1934/m.4213 type:complete len:243 (-) Transcript_1934:5-733(-)
MPTPARFSSVGMSRNLNYLVCVILLIGSVNSATPTRPSFISSATFSMSSTTYSESHIPRRPTSLFFREDTDPAVKVQDLSSMTNNKKSARRKQPTDFKSRMKRILVQQQSSGSKAQTHPSTKKNTWRPENVRMAVSLEDFSKEIEEGRKMNKLIVVRFFATWCKTCHALRPSYDKLASANLETIFLDVPVTDTNANLHQGLGVPSVPYSHIYHPEKGLVEETKLSRKTLAEFGELIEKYTMM